MTRAKRDFGTIRKRANGRWQAYYMGPDQAFHRAPSTFDAKVDAQDARDDEQFDASWRRSAIQLFLDHHADVLGAPVNEARRIGISEDVELLDDELRRLGEAYGPLPDDELPRGLPRHHWWWWPAPLLGGPHERYPGWDEPR
ncbi:MAG TPA: hypothetical protein PLA46_06290 [Phycicoccus sp.]|nr:hypothetical protein [Phycicoccus sp.]